MSIVTLSTDIGLNDYIVGAVKGQLLSAIPTLNIVDNTHYLTYSNYPQSAYLCNCAFKYFPPDTFHIVILNLFDMQPDHLLLARYNDQYIACPDNGILTMITAVKPEEVVRIPVVSPWGSSITTLDFTAAIANALETLEKGAILADLGEYPELIEEKYPLRATFGPDWIEGQIIFIDHFENVVINVTREDFEMHRKGRIVKVQFTRNEMIKELSDNYASAGVGNLLAWFNSAGYLELAINKGNVAGLFGLQGFGEGLNSGHRNSYFYKTVRIFFEENTGAAINTEQASIVIVERL